MSEHSTHTPAGSGPHHLIIGTVTVSRLLGAAETDSRFSLVELRGLPGSGPGPHVDPWDESFYVLEGELTFRVEEEGAVREIAAAAGDAVSIPTGVPHMFRVSSETPARYLILGTPAGIDAFFADAGEPVGRPDLPAGPQPFDRERLLAAFAKYGLKPRELPALAQA